MINSKNTEISNLKSKLDLTSNQDQEMVSKIFQINEEVTNLNQLIEPKRMKLEALRIKTDELKSKHWGLSDAVSLLKGKESQLRLEVEAQEKYMERLIEETENLISEKHYLQSKKNDLKSRESLSISTIIPPKPKAVNTDNCPVCFYPKVGRVKICKTCNSAVHQKCMLYSECFNCNPPNK